MISFRCLRNCGLLSALSALASLAAPASAAVMPTVGEVPAYHPITPSMAGQTILLTGDDLTIDEVIEVAHDGASVAVSPRAKQHMADAYGLLLEGSTEGVSIYWFNRGAGGARETVMFAGDPESPENRPKVAETQMRSFRAGADGGYPPEVSDEEIVRAMMVIRPFFTVVKASEILPKGGYGGSGGYTPIDLWQEIQSLAVPIAAEGNAGGQGVEELQSQSRLKTARARQLVAASLSLVAFDVTNGARWIDVRKVQNGDRRFGAGVEAAWAAYRKAFPLDNDAPGGVPQNPNAVAIYGFLNDTPAIYFFAGPPMPAGAPIVPVRW